MRKLTLVAAALLVACLVPASASAWGFAAHRYITRRALELLPPELKPFYQKYGDEVVMRCVDPDLWRNAGWDEEGNHFINFGVREYGPPPFAAVPRDYGAALDRFGIVTLKRHGLLPWRTAEEFANLRRTFEEFKGQNPYAASNLPLFTGIAAHYIEDANQPFHTTTNYDGQLTMQTGLHNRFERDLFERFGSRLTLTPAPPTPIGDIRDFVFAATLASYAQVEAVLKADKDAIGAGDVYDDAYFERFFAAARPVLERQMSAAITATASLIVGAWEQAGRPTPRLTDLRPVEKRQGK